MRMIPHGAGFRTLLAGNTDEIREQWEHTQAADELQPVPPGPYVCHVHGGELEANRKGTPQYTLVFRIIEGEHVGRQLWHPLYLTPAALPMAKRDLSKLGITQLEQLENGTIPSGRIRCRVRVGLRSDDSGERFNRVRGPLPCWV